MAKIRAFLFDFDGLLANTEPLHFAGFREIVALYGVKLSEQDYFKKYVGLDDRDGFAEIFADAGITGVDLAEVLPRKANLMQALFRSELQACPGAVDFVLSLKQSGRYELGICSGALRAEVQLGIQSLGIAHCFSDIVTADDVAKSKPGPEGYQRLVQLLSARAIAKGQAPISADTCVVLEDTIAGITSGKAAGCITVGVLGTENRATLEQYADVVVDSLGLLDPMQLEVLVR